MEHIQSPGRIQRLVSVGAVVMSSATLSACFSQEAGCGVAIRTDQTRFIETYLPVETGGTLGVSYDRKSDQVLVELHGERTRLAVDSLPVNLEMGDTAVAVTLSGDMVKVDC